MKPRGNTTGLPQIIGTQATNANHQLITPQITQALEIRLADMAQDRTLEMILWVVHSPTTLLEMTVVVFAPLAVIKLAAEEVVVVDTTLMVEVVVVVELPTLEEPLPFPEIQILHVMDVAKTIMSWPVPPLQLKENGLYLTKTDQDQHINNLRLVHLILKDKVPMVLLTMLKIKLCQQDKFLQQEMHNRLNHRYIPMDTTNHPDT
jgi:hypothetical protein